MQLQVTRSGEVSPRIHSWQDAQIADGHMRWGRGSAEGVGARSGKGLHSTYDGNPRVGVRTGARHEDGRYTDIFVSRYPCPLDAGGFNEPNKTVVK